MRYKQEPHGPLVSRSFHLRTLTPDYSPWSAVEKEEHTSDHSTAIFVEDLALGSNTAIPTRWWFISVSKSSKKQKTVVNDVQYRAGHSPPARSSALQKLNFKFGPQAGLVQVLENLLQRRSAGPCLAFPLKLLPRFCLQIPPISHRH